MNTAEANQANNPAAINKATAKKAVLFSLGTLALGTLAFFGIKYFKKSKNNSDDNSNQTMDEQDDKIPVQSPANSKLHTSSASASSGASFPLGLHSKGAKVVKLQQALVRAYGSAILPKFGADGFFGTELRDALRAKGFTVPLSEADFQKIVQVQVPKPLAAFDPAAVAKGIYASIAAKDFNSGILLLKIIKTTVRYSQVSQQLQRYFINGVRQTLVNAMLSTFNESSQKAKVRETFLSMGLKYNASADRWSLT